MKIVDTSNLDRVCRTSLNEFREANIAGSLVIGDQQYDDIVQKFILFRSKDEIFNDIIKPIIVRNLYEVEGQAAGAAALSLHFIMMSFDLREREQIKKVDKDYVIKILNKLSKIKPTQSEILGSIKISSTPEIREILQEAIKISNRDDQIEVRRTHTDKTRLHRSFGYNFTEVKADGVYTLTKPWSRKKVNVILIDGVIEKAFHLEKILSLSNEEKSSWLIIAREATEEVKIACSNNFLRKTTDVVVCTVPYSEKTAHFFNDIKIICNSIPINLEMGDLISPLIYKKAVLVDQVTLTSESIKFVNDTTEYDVSLLKERLQKQIQEINDDQVTDLIRKRIKSLSGSTIVIDVGDDIAFKTRNCIEQIDRLIRKTKDTTAYGLIDKKSIENFPIFEELNIKDKLPITTISLMVAINQIFSFLEVYKNSGIIILND